MSHVPPGWPDSVPPPGTLHWEQKAVGWLLDVLPPNYRDPPAEDIRQYPLALAAMARHHVRACWESARHGYRIARTELGPSLPPQAIPAVLTAYRSEGTRLAELGKAIRVIEPALREAAGPTGRIDSTGHLRTGLAAGRAGSGRLPPRGRRANGVAFLRARR
jgi:hypothetical protein